MSHIGKLHKLKCQTLTIFDSIIVGPQNDDTTSIICQFGTRAENADAVMSERLKNNFKVEVQKENMEEVRGRLPCLASILLFRSESAMCN